MKPGDHLGEAAQKVARPLLLGHRGARKYAPENTMSAFQLALQHGCDGFEFDVRYTRDKRGIVCHDPWHRNRELCKCEFSDLGLPAAVDVIRSFAGRAYLDVELKELGLEEALWEALKQVPVGDFLVSSFVPAILENVHEQLPQFRLGLICETERELAEWRELPFLAAIMLHYQLASDASVKSFNDDGLEVFVWTVNRKEEMLRFAQMGVRGLISDDTKLLAETFKDWHMV